MHYLPAVVSLLGPRTVCKKVDSLQSIPCSPMQGATLSHPRYYPHIPARTLNIPHNKAKGSDSYYFQPSRLEARGEAKLPLGVLRGRQASSPKKLLRAEPMPHATRQGWEKIGIFICLDVHNIEVDLCGQLRSTTISEKGEDGWVGGDV